MITSEQITTMLQEAGYKSQCFNESFIHLETDERPYVISVQESADLLTYCNISIIYDTKGILTNFGSTAIVSNDVVSAHDTEELFDMFNNINYNSLNVKICSQPDDGKTITLSSGFWAISTNEFMLYFKIALQQLNSAAEEIEENLFRGCASHFSLRGC